MSESASITIGSYEFISRTNTLGDLLLFFSPEDLRVVEEPDEDSVDQSRVRYVFVSTVDRAKQCLDALGYTVKSARKAFDLSKESDLYLFEHYNGGTDWAGHRVDALREHLTFETWSKAAQRFALLLSQDCFTVGPNGRLGYARLEELMEDETLTLAEKYVMKSLPFDHHESYFGIRYDCTSFWEVFRVLLGAFEPTQTIELDYTSLVDSGWCDEFPSNGDYDVAPKIIVLTEGKYDAEVISRSMRVLYPHMSKFYSFMDFSAVNVQGGAGALTQYVKAFAGAGIQNQVIAIYDNDAIGQSELRYLETITLPENYRVMSLPGIDLAVRYPTTGPTSDERVNINGRACSIELYLGRDVLSTANGWSPVMWRGLVDRTKTYQGELTDKSEVQRRFEIKLLDAENTGVRGPENWAEMDLVLNAIFRAFN